MADKFNDRIEGTVQTTDATTATVATFPLVDEAVYLFEVFVVGLVGGGNAAGYRLCVSAKRVLAGGATLVGTVDKAIGEDAPQWDADIDVNGNNVRVRVTGQAAVTIDWFAHGQCIVLVP